MTAQFKNNVTATLAASISSTTTIIIVSSGQGAYFPLPSGGSYFYATLYDASNNIEIVKCTARTGDALTVLRGVDNSVANSYNAGDKVVMRVVAAALSNFAQQDGNNTFTGSNIFSGGLAGNLTGNTAGTHTGPVIGNADTATNATNATNATKATNAINATNATNLVTAAFSVKEVSGKLYFYYGATQIASLDSSGNFIALGSQTTGGTP